MLYSVPIFYRSKVITWGEVCFELRMRMISVNFQKTVQVRSEDCFILNPIVLPSMTSYIRNWYDNNPQSKNSLVFRNLLLFPTHIVFLGIHFSVFYLFRLYRNNSHYMVPCFQFCLSWDWGNTISTTFSISLHHWGVWWQLLAALSLKLWFMGILSPF